MDVIVVAALGILVALGLPVCRAFRRYNLPITSPRAATTAAVLEYAACTRGRIRRFVAAAAVLPATACGHDAQQGSRRARLRAAWPNGGWSNRSATQSAHSARNSGGKAWRP